MSVQLVVRIPQQQKKLLELAAKKKSKTVSELVRIALSSFLKMKEKNLLDELSAIAEEGKQIKGYPTDISSNYKKYLYGSD